MLRRVSPRETNRQKRSPENIIFCIRMDILDGHKLSILPYFAETNYRLVSGPPPAVGRRSCVDHGTSLKRHLGLHFQAIQHRALNSRKSTDHVFRRPYQRYY